jgi:hypothetical protein
MRDHCTGGRGHDYFVGRLRRVTVLGLSDTMSSGYDAERLAPGATSEPSLLPWVVVVPSEAIPPYAQGERASGGSSIALCRRARNPPMALRARKQVGGEDHSPRGVQLDRPQPGHEGAWRDVSTADYQAVARVEIIRGARDVGV